ncbi:helix-turn-helix domain-containing protein [Rasiella sp. SM2506]|uniref:helix-turn-helix domain-containing protein n=1 Tax=Rasiella sp. SM2506 TaxID=3423914 RepID=UPI003D7AEC55
MKKSFATNLSYEIPQELKKIVVSIIEGKSEYKLDTVYPVFATGHPLIIYVYDSIPIISVNSVETKPTSRVHIAGQIFDADISIKLQGKFGQIGLVLHPLTTYYLFHKPGSYFLNKWSNFQNVVPTTVNKDLHLVLSTCKTTDERIETLLEFLKSLLETKLPEIKWLEAAITKIYTLGGNITQEELSRGVDISLRHFRRKFKEVVGISPKYFCKVIQLNTVFELLNTSNTEKLHHLALDCGYYDQAHFIHDFKKMIGSSPRNFLEGKDSFVKEYMGRKSL